MERHEAPRSRVQAWQVILAAGFGSFLGSAVACGGVGAWLAGEILNRAGTVISSWETLGTVQGVDYRLEGPAQVTRGERFTLRAVVQNTTAGPRTLHSLDLYSNQTVHSTTPAFTRRDGDTLYYNLPLTPGQPLVIEIEAEATSAGFEDVNIDANIDSPFNYTEAFHSLDVVELAPGNPETPAP